MLMAGPVARAPRSDADIRARSFPRVAALSHGEPGMHSSFSLRLRNHFGHAECVIEPEIDIMLADDVAGAAATKPLRVRSEPGERDAERTVADYPAAPGQLQMWFLQHYAPESPVYNIPMAFRLRGSVDVSRLESAFASVIRRHDTLRTSFAMEQGRLIQQVWSSIPLPMRQVSLERLPEAKREDAARGRVEELACRPFELTAAPPLRIELLRLDATHHVLVMVIHHIIFDGWSQGNFCRELSLFYADESGDELAELPMQFVDYAALSQERMQDGAFAEDVSYWQKKLGGQLPRLDLPLDRPRTPVSTFGGENCSIRLDRELLVRLKTRAQEERATLFMLLLAVFKLLLFRYTGQKDVRVGIPFANRQGFETEEMIGFFVNTLVLRTSLEGEPKFRELLQRVKTTAIEAFSHSALPFEKLVELTQSAAGTDRVALVETLFALEASEQPLALDGLIVSQLPVGTRTAKMDLSLFVTEDAEGWTAKFEYNTDLLDHDRIERMLGHFQVLLEELAADPGQGISEVPILTKEEKHRLLVEWNQTERSYPRHHSVHRSFEEQVAATPNAVAIIANDISLTYAELDEQADKVAAYLTRAGVGRGDIVGVAIERSPQMIAGLLGILKAGGTYWGIEEDLPAGRLERLLSNAEPRLVLTSDTSKFALKLPANASVVAMEDLLAARGQDNYQSALTQATDPAYVSYTSGSTGQPKGVVIPHRGVIRLVKSANYLSLERDETLLHMAPLSFDASTFEIWGALLNGGRLVLMPPGQPTLSDIGTAIARHGVTTLWLTSGLFHLIVDERLEDLRPLRQLIAGGDVLSPKHVFHVSRALPACRIVNGYGPTENTTFSCCYEIPTRSELGESIPIGRPISNTRVYVANSSLSPIPVGVDGELYLAGDGLAIGYLNQPQLTSERFLLGSFGGQEGERVYRTGDRVRWRSDGILEFRGRLDSEVKIRGHRIELSEIESVLKACPGVSEAVLTKHGDLSAGALAAYLVLDEEGQGSIDRIRDYAQKRLPSYMVPATFTILDRFPLSENGKVDRRQLPEPKISFQTVAKESDQPLNLLEMEMIRLWEWLFLRGDIRRTDNFFTLGGHSLLAARLMSEIDRRFGCKLPIAAVFHAPTIETLCQRLTEERCAPAWTSLVPLQPAGTKPPLFFTHGWGGDVFSFQRLARLLAPGQPSYGLQAVGLDGKTPRHTSVEQMAAHYLKEIRSFQPSGPYYLAGYSMGGLIAYELGQQLSKLGEKVAFLALLDTGPRSVPWGVYMRTLTPFWRQRCGFHFQHWRHMPKRERLRYLLQCGKGFHGWLRRNRPVPPVITASPTPATQTPDIPGFGDYYWAVASAYKFRRYPGALDVFVSDSADPKFITLWRHLARSGATLHRVPGTHHEIMGIMGEDYLPTLAQALQEALDSLPKRAGERDPVQSLSAQADRNMESRLA